MRRQGVASWTPSLRPWRGNGRCPAAVVSLVNDSMTLASGLLSSSKSPASTVQLIDALGPHAHVLVHHDAAKGPASDLGRRRTARLIRDPVAAAWGEWSLCEANVQAVLGNSGVALGDSHPMISRFDDAHPSRLGLDRYVRMH
jgi:hypothetical protein